MGVVFLGGRVLEMGESSQRRISIWGWKEGKGKGRWGRAAQGGGSQLGLGLLFVCSGDGGSRRLVPSGPLPL